MTRTQEVLKRMGAVVPDEITARWINNVLEKISALQKDIDETRTTGHNFADLYHTKEELTPLAKLAADNEEAGKPPAKFLGGLRENPFKRGDRVTIPKGSVFRQNGEMKTAKKTYTVIVHNVNEGFINEASHRYSETDRIVNPAITWAGTGGYWCDLKLGQNPEVTKAAC